MIDDHFRQLLARSSPLIVRLYGRTGLTPNGLTLGALLFAALAAVACGAGLVWPTLGLWWLGRLLDGTDGILARGSGRQTDFGAYLDIVGDMAAYSLMVLGFLWRYPDQKWAWVGMLFFYVLCISSALALGTLCDKRGIASDDNRGLRLGAGLAEGGETGLAYTLFLLMPQEIGTLSAVWLAVLAFTVAARTLLAKKLLRH